MKNDGHESVTVTAVGDIMFDRMVRPPRVLFYMPEAAASIPRYNPALPLPFLNTEESIEWLHRRGVSTEGVDKTSHASESILLDFPPDALDPAYPFRGVRSVLSQSDLVFGNLECPLSARGRPVRNDLCYRASPDFARALADANFKVLSFANNHCMDYGEVAFLDTLAELRRNGIQPVGAGEDYHEACRPSLFDVRGVRVAFVAFNLYGPDSTFALPDESGVVPLNGLTIERVVGGLRGRVDFIFASMHWGHEGVGTPSTDMIKLAHQLVDAGADVILGHHQHIPGSIEVYRSKPIIYSLGNFIFGHSHNHWTDNMIVNFALSEGRVKRVELLPVGSRGMEQYQPTILSGERAEYLVTFVAVHSELFGTPIAFNGGRGVIELEGLREGQEDHGGVGKVACRS
jgi:poly-gamma-glutamate synthesis protein (capsule biosynthesis protein)